MNDYVITNNSTNPPIGLLTVLCVCHEAYVSKQGVSSTQLPAYDYEGQSQDEICILDYCKSHGCIMTNRTEETISLWIDC